jgi:hypothetical protein
MSYKVTDTVIVDQNRNLGSIGVATFTGPLLIGGGSSTGTVSQPLQVLGTNGAYIGGNLGIGSTNPSSKLSVIGDATFSGIVTSSVVNVRTDPGTGIATDFTNSVFGNGWIQNAPASTTYYRLAILPVGSGGNTFDHLRIQGVLGAWTNDNQTPFDIYFSNRGAFDYKYISYGSIRNDVIILGISTNSTVEIWAQHQASAFTKLVYNIPESIEAIVIPNPTSTTTAPVGTTVFDTSTTQPRFIINESDNFGVGTTNPTSKLWVNGDGYFTGILTANRVISTAYGEFTGGISGTNIVGTSLSISGISTLGVTSATDLTAQQLNVSGVSTFSNTLRVIPTSTGIAGLFSGNTSTDLVRITQTGSGNALVVEDSTNPDASPFVIKGDGYGWVGIGTTNPREELHLQSVDPIIRFTEDGATSDNGNWNVGVNNETLYFQAINDSGGGGGNTFRFTRSSNQIVSFEGRNAANTWFIINNTTQRIGIGTTNPTSALTVQGNARVSGVVTATTFIGALTGTATTATNVIGGIGSIAQLQVTGISTFTNGPVIIGTATSTGTESQRLQVTGDAYISGKLGIGSTVPGVELTVIGSIQAGSATTYTTVGQDGGRNIELGVGSTTLPTYIDFQGSAAYTDYATRLIRNSGDNGVFNIINRGTGSLRLVAQDAGNIDFVTNNTFRHRINDDGIFFVGAATSTGTAGQVLQVTGGAYVSGSVGIGTTNPGSKLTVNGAVQIQQDSGSNNRFILRGQPTSSYRWNVDNFGSANDFRIFREDDATAANGVSLVSISTTGTLTAIKFSGDGSLLTNLPPASSDWVTTSVGIHTLSNVGIGTTNPTSKLTVSGSASITGILTADQVYTSNNGNGQNVRIGDDFWIGDVNASNTTRFSGAQDSAKAFIIFGSSDAVALGRTGTGPLYYGGDFTISGVSTANSFRARGGAPGALGVNNNGYGFFSPGDNDSGMYSSADGQIEFYSNNTEAVRIDSNQRVGIGTTNPTQTLHVQGNARVTGAVYDSTNLAGTSGQVLQSTETGTRWVNAAPSNAITGLTIFDEGSPVGSANSVSQLNFVGDIVSVASTAGIATVTFSNYVSIAGVATYATAAGISTNLKGGTGGSIPYQSAADTTVFLTNGSSGQILQSNGGTSAPTWVNAAPAGAITGLTVRDEGNIVGGANSISQFNFVGNIVSVGTSVGIATITFSNFVSNAGTSTSVIGGIASVTQLSVSSGISTLGVTSTTNLTARQLNVSGISTLTNATGTNINYTGVGTIATLNSTVATLTNLGGTNINVTGIVTANSFSGSGASLTALNASNLSSGIVPTARITGSSGDFSVGQNLFVNGNVSIGGTTTLVYAQQLRISDRDITLGVTTAPNGNDISTDITANHGGISIASTVGTPIIGIPTDAVNTDPSTYKQMMWIRQNHYSGFGTDAWLFNYGVSIGNTATVQNLSRLTVGAGFTVYDNYIDVQDIRNRNINTVGVVTATTFIGALTGTATTATNVIGGIGSIAQLQVTGISTFTNGPVLIGAATSTGTASQPLQVTGGAYVSSNVGVAVTSPSFAVDVSGDARVQSTGKMRFGGTTVSTNFYIQYNSTANSLDFVAG